MIPWVGGRPSMASSLAEVTVDSEAIVGRRPGAMGWEAASALEFRARGGKFNDTPHDESFFWISTAT